MKSTLRILTATALVVAFSGAAVAADKPSPQNVPGTAVEGNANSNNSGSMSSPEANKSDMAPSSATSDSGNAAANIPGTNAEGNSSEDKGTLSGDNSAPAMPGSGESGNASANIPGAKADGKATEANPSLGGGSKDTL
jgi:hypothetical protein